MAHSVRLRGAGHIEGAPGLEPQGLRAPAAAPNPFGYGGPNYPASATSSSRRDPIPSFW